MAGLVSLLRSIPLSPLASRALSFSGASPLLRLRPLVAAVRVGFSLRRNPVRSGLRCFSTRPTTSSLNDLSLSGASPWLRLRPLVAAVGVGFSLRRNPVRSVLRCFSTRPTTSSLNDPSPNWSTGRDFEQWLVFVESPDPSDPSLTRDEIIDGLLLDVPPDPSLTRDIIDSYIKPIAERLGSEEEARISIYSVSTKHYFAFDCKVSKEITYKIKPLPKDPWVLPNSYLDVKNKDYGGEPFIDGKAVPYDPQQNFQNREAPPVQNQDFPSQNSTQHTSQATPPVRDGATPNFQNQPSPNYHNQHGGYIPNYQGGSRGYQGGPGGPGYQGDQGYQSGFPRSNIPGGGFGSNGSSPDYPGDNVTGSSPGYPRGNPAYQVNPGGYQGGSFATPPIYQGGNSARPGSHTGYQGGSPSDYQGGGPPPTAYPGGYQGGAPAYQGGSPVGREVFNQPFQGQGVTSGYPPPNSRYQGGSQNNQQGGEGYKGGSPVYPGRDLPGRDQ
ncbi:uncharacterized protein LOC141839419 [Curcuma longa]|uniref:uncharacterized protein LOC141839419 n=1 Tax=Curcuma longa TaxID=136217 RepID=UPI003D9FABC8